MLVHEFPARIGFQKDKCLPATDGDRVAIPFETDFRVVSSNADVPENVDLWESAKGSPTRSFSLDFSIVHAVNRGTASNAVHTNQFLSLMTPRLGHLPWADREIVPQVF